MSRIKTMLAAMVAVLAIGAVGASAAQADGTVSGTITGPNTECNFTADYTGGPPPASVTIVGDSVQLFEPPPDPPLTCDPDTIEDISNIDVDFNDLGTPPSSNWQASLGQFSVTAQVLGGISCEFQTTGTINTDLPGPGSVSGPYSGSGSANPTGGGSGGFGCFIAGTQTLGVQNVVFN